jgi:hypothetical protein
MLVFGEWGIVVSVIGEHAATVMLLDWPGPGSNGQALRGQPTRRATTPSPT